MPTKGFTEEQIAFALRQAESGTPVGEVCRKLGISEQSFYRWKKQFAGMGISEIRRLKQLEDENTKLKRLVADLTLDKTMLQDALRKKWQGPPRSARSSTISRRPTASVSGGPSVSAAQQDRRTGTDRSGTRKRRYGCG